MQDDVSSARRPTGQTVLVTGGAGFIGGQLATDLTTDNDVRVLDDLSTGTRENVPDATTLIEGDVRDNDLVASVMEDVDIVYHEAGLVSVPESIAAPTRSHAINVEGTLHVLEAARQKDARVVIASSAAIYGEPDTNPVAEDTLKQPTSPYGADKLAADRYARVYTDVYDLPTVTLRYFNVFGHGQNPEYSGVIDAFISQALAGDPLTVHGDGEQTRDFVHVDDVVHANLAAGITPHTGRSYNIGTGQSVSINQLARLIQDITGTDAPIEHGPARAGDIRHSEAVIDRAQQFLEYDPHVTLREGLKTMVDRRHQ